MLNVSCRKLVMAVLYSSLAVFGLGHMSTLMRKLGALSHFPRFFLLFFVCFFLLFCITCDIISSNLIQIICTQLYGFNSSYLIIAQSAGMGL